MIKVVPAMRRLVAALLAVALVPFVHADDPPPSGLKIGAEVTPFHAFNVTGKRAGRHHCLVCEHGLSPVVLVFVPPSAAMGATPLRTFLQKAEATVLKYPARAPGAGVVVLSDDVDNEDKLPDLRKKLEEEAGEAKLNRVVHVIDKAAGPKAYGVNSGHTTIIFYDRLKVVGNFAFPEALTEKDVHEKLLPALEKTMSGKR